MLMAPSGHENPRTLSLYVKPSAKAVARALASAGPQPPAALTMPIGSQRVTGGSVPDAPQRQPDT